MSDFKLFGKTINVSSLHQNHHCTDLENSCYEEETTATTITTASSISGANKKPKTSSPEIESLIQTIPEKVEADDEEERETEKPLKKPDKILACPRCKSTDTKFCYYNNYNVNQPRHLCKKCQRYWTAGGSIRNIPVGAGRRKNKASAFRQIMLSESIRVQAAINGLQDPYLVANNSTTFLTFGRDQTKEQAVGKSNQKFVGKVPYVANGICNGFSHYLGVLQANPAALCRSLNFHESN